MRFSGAQLLFQSTATLFKTTARKDSVEPITHLLFPDFKFCKFFTIFVGRCCYFQAIVNVDDKQINKQIKVET